MRTQMLLLLLLLLLLHLTNFTAATWGFSPTLSRMTSKLQSSHMDRKGGRHVSRTGRADVEPRAAGDDSTTSEPQSVSEQMTSGMSQLKRSMATVAPVVVVAGALGGIFIIILIKNLLNRKKKQGFTFNYYKPAHDFAIRIDYGPHAHYDPSQYQHHQPAGHGAADSPRRWGPEYGHHADSEAAASNNSAQRSGETENGVQAQHWRSPAERQQHERLTIAYHPSGSETRKQDAHPTPAAGSLPSFPVRHRQRDPPARQQHQW